jgi:peptide-methionine (R)-S-oxide reductase
MDKKQKYLPEDIYNICWRQKTEPPFSGKYNKHFEVGNYNCVSCGNKLFSSNDKYDSGTGWPSFFDIASSDAVHINQDNSHDMQRMEVACKKCGAHLGHVFDDGPKPTNKRYCINSLALEFLSDDK